MKTPKTFERGAVYGMLTLISVDHFRNGDPMVKVQCECGTTKVARLAAIRHGSIKSCGCYLRSRAKNATKHGQCIGRKQTPEYKSYYAMLTRCYSGSHKSFSRYGGRGITVCDRWKDSFENFFSDMGVKPSPKHSIDRINNDGNYEPGNCRWATKHVQCRNRTNNKILDFKGQKFIAKDLADIFGISKNNLLHRLKKGWSVEEAITVPIGNGRTKRTRDKIMQGKSWKEIIIRKEDA